MPEQRLNPQAQVEELERELAEIELLLQQTGTEAQRNENRRQQQVERLAVLERDPKRDADTVSQARQQLMEITRRTMVMEAQVQILESKKKALERFRDFVTALPPVQDDAAATPSHAADDTPPTSRALLAAQEAMRREIARQMHDGPAQSIANIALQAQVVQHLLERDAGQAKTELARLVQMVQLALDSTKSFIFGVRPMVLDDLGLVATLRRASLEKTRRYGVNVRFESVGQDRRLDHDLESGLFRILEAAMDGFVTLRPKELSMRLDWTDDAVRASVHSPVAQAADRLDLPAEQDADGEGHVPPALASVMRERQQSVAAKASALQRQTALPEEIWARINDRAAALGIELALEEEGHLLQVVAQTSQSNGTNSPFPS